MNLKTKSLTGGCCFLLMAISLWSQQGKIEGVVTDKQGNPLDGVFVTIISTRVTTGHIERKTDKEGKFVQIGLWPGLYQINFKKAGFAPVSMEVRVEITETKRVAITMEEVERALERSLSEADRLFVEGNRFYARGENEKAAGAFLEAIRLNPNHWGYHFNLGLALKKMGKMIEARLAFEKAGELNPESLIVMNELAEAMAMLGDYEEARHYYQKAVDAGAHEADVFYNYGVVLNSMGKPDEALAAFLKALEINDKYAEVYFQMGTIYIGQNKVKEALENLEKFLELAPDHEKAPLAKNLIEFLKKSGFASRPH